MGLRIYMWLQRLLHKRNQAMHKYPHDCESCNETSVPLYQISILNIGFWILLGVIAAIFTKIYIGFILAFLLIAINGKLIKPQCRKCLSTKIHLHSGDKEVKTLESETI